MRSWPVSNWPNTNWLMRANYSRKMHRNVKRTFHSGNEPVFIRYYKQGFGIERPPLNGTDLGNLYFEGVGGIMMVENATLYARLKTRSSTRRWMDTRRSMRWWSVAIYRFPDGAYFTRKADR